MMEIVKNSETEFNITLKAEEYNKLQTLLSNLEIREFSDDTIVISSNKNVVIHSQNNILTLAEGSIINKAKMIHLNPFIGVKRLFKKLLTKENLEEIK